MKLVFLLLLLLELILTMAKSEEDHDHGHYHYHTPDYGIASGFQGQILCDHMKESAEANKDFVDEQIRKMNHGKKFFDECMKKSDDSLRKAQEIMDRLNGNT